MLPVRVTAAEVPELTGFSSRAPRAHKDTTAPLREIQYLPKPGTFRHSIRC